MSCSGRRGDCVVNVARAPELSSAAVDFSRTGPTGDAHAVFHVERKIDHAE